MAISFVSAGAITPTGTSSTPALPAGLQAGDILICAAWISKNNFATTPTGYTLISQASSVTNSTCNLFYKIATAGETSPTFNPGGTAGASVLLAYRGVSGLDVTATAFAASTSSSSLTGNSLTTTAANDFVLTAISTEGSGNNVFTPPAGVNVRVQQNETATLTGFLLYDELQASAGAYTPKTTTIVQTRKYVVLSTSLLATILPGWLMMF